MKFPCVVCANNPNAPDWISCSIISDPNTPKAVIYQLSDWLNNALEQGINSEIRQRCPGFRFKLSEDQEEIVKNVYFNLNMIKDAEFDPASTSRPVFIICGPAGTGKTTVIQEFLSRTPSAVLLAPTGKAASRLSEVTGYNAQTIHSYFYGVPQTYGQCPKCEEYSLDIGVSSRKLERKQIYTKTCPYCQHMISTTEKVVTELRFEAAINIQGSPSAIFIDEGSMINEEMLDDILKNVPIKVPIFIFMDQYQLPPVKGSMGIKAEQSPFKLTKVHRQAKDSGILKAAMNIRSSMDRRDIPKFPHGFFTKSPDTVVLTGVNIQLAADWLARKRSEGEDATLITYTNATRKALNFEVRKKRGLIDECQKRNIPVVSGDKLVLRSNSSVFRNGEIVTVTNSGWFDASRLAKNSILWVELEEMEGRYYIPADNMGDNKENFKDLRNQIVRDWVIVMGNYTKAKEAQQRSGDKKLPYPTNLPWEKEITSEDYGEKQGIPNPDNLLFADFGECITCHVSQGSQFNQVGVVWDSSCWGMWFRSQNAAIQTEERISVLQWLYTVVTRAVNGLTMFFIKKEG